jgi:uncharacterized membrane protein YphA (DoxX/SURF4 family)
MSGLGKLADYSGVVAMIATAGLPLAPLGLLIAVIIEADGGLLLLGHLRLKPSPSRQLS